MFEAAHSQESDSSDIGYLDKKPKRRYFDFNVENQMIIISINVLNITSLFPSSFPPLSFNNFY